LTRRPVRLLHSSDLHLGAEHGLLGPGWHGAGCVCPLQSLVTAAARHRCDLVLIAGDIFDSNRVRETVVLSALEVLAGLTASCVIVPGNHDALDETSVYGRYDFEAAAPRLRVVRRPEGESIEFPGLTTRVWARAMVDHDPRNRPLAGAPPRAGDRWSVVVAHGHFMEGEADELAQVRSSPIYRHDLAAVAADYVALGHWDLPEQVGSAPVAWYAGAPALGGFAQAGLLVTLDPETGVAVESLALESNGAAGCLGLSMSSGAPTCFPGYP
jgi:DNA repair protein SbcD/Mre11